MRGNTYWYISEAAREIGVHPVTLKRWFRDGRPSFFVRRRVSGGRSRTGTWLDDASGDLQGEVDAMGRLWLEGEEGGG